MRTDRPFPGAWFALALTAGVVGFQVMLAVLLEAVGAAYAAMTRQPALHPAQNPLVMGFVNLVAIGVVVAGGIVLTRAPVPEILAFRRVRGVLFLPIVLATAGGAIVLSEADNLFRWLFPMPEFFADFFRELLSEEWGWWRPAFALVVVAPLTEEVLFRGLILRGLLSRYRVRAALLISATLFALAHLNPWQLVSAGALGVLFGWWYYRTRSLIPGLIGHVLVNGAVLAFHHLPVEISGFNSGDPYAQVEFQPLWLDTVGLALLALGVWLFHRWSPEPEPASPSPYDGPPPPVIAPPVCGPSA